MGRLKSLWYCRIDYGRLLPEVTFFVSDRDLVGWLRHHKTHEINLDYQEFLTEPS